MIAGAIVGAILGGCIGYLLATGAIAVTIPYVIINPMGGAVAAGGAAANMV